MYFDFNKAISLLSQLEGGIITEIEEQFEKSRDERNIRNYDLKLFKPQFGGKKTEKKSTLENKVLHHAIYKRIVKQLRKKNLIININDNISTEEIDNGKSYEKIKNKFSIYCNGWSYIEDYQKLLLTLDNFNPLIDFISKCYLSGLENNEDFIEMQKEIEEQKKQVEKLQGKKKIIAEKQIEQIEKQIRDMTKNLSGIERLPDWFINGLKIFMDTFIANRINIRIYPFYKKTEFHVIANLKKKWFVDTDLENILFAYGTRPNIKLSIFGLITSLPSNEEKMIDPLSQYEYYMKKKKLDSDINFEKSFRKVFVAMEEFEKFVRFSRYPNITIYPIAVFRDIKSEN